jgi:hypothetical protein
MISTGLLAIVSVLCRTLSLSFSFSLHCVSLCSVVVVVCSVLQTPLPAHALTQPHSLSYLLCLSLSLCLSLTHALAIIHTHTHTHFHPEIHNIVSLQSLYIVICVCLGVLVLAIVALLVWCCWYQRRRQKRTAFDSDEWDDYLDEERQAFLDSANRREKEEVRQISSANKRRLEMERRATHKKPSI